MTLQDKVTGLSHVAIAVPDLENAIHRFERVFGVTPQSILRNPEQKVRMAYLDLPGFRIELITATDPDSPVGRFLERNPRGGIHHLSLNVSELDAVRAAFAGAGWASLGEPTRNVHGQRIQFLDPKYLAGLLVELEEAPLDSN